MNEFSSLVMLLSKFPALIKLLSIYTIPDPNFPGRTKQKRLSGTIVNAATICILLLGVVGYIGLGTSKYDDAFDHGSP